ncbi:unnamed protein product, partial [Didymodactylos carnosus]
MGNGCCGLCNKKAIEAQVAVLQTQNVEEKETPFGYVFIYPGVQTSNKTYTCPVLSIHTYRESLRKTEIGYEQTTYFTDKKKREQLGPVSTSKEESLSADEAVIIIPVEDIFSISYTSEIKKHVKAQDHSRLVPVAAKKSCCDAFRCCCCKKKKIQPIRENTIIEAKDARREITIHIEYSKYSNLDSASNARLLSSVDQVAFYQCRFTSDTTLKFYLINNTEFEQANFNRKKDQAESLCRTIMQLKAMRVNNYPDPEELQKIIHQPISEVFGDPLAERVHSIRTQKEFGTHGEPSVTTETFTAFT